MDRKCGKCTEVVLGNRVVCIDCERKGKPCNRERRCAFPECKASYRASRGNGRQKYCMEHKGMTSREREALIKSMGQTS